MDDQDEHFRALADRLSEATSYYQEFARRSKTLRVAQTQTAEISRLFHAGDRVELRRLIDGFRGIDDSQYGSQFSYVVKLVSDFLDAESTGES